MSLFRNLLFTGLLIASLITTQAEDWPGWRGPRDDGTSLETNLPPHWSARHRPRLPQQGERRAVPSLDNS